MRCGVPRVRLRKARHSGGAGAPPGSTMRPCQELADDLSFALSAFGLLERESVALSASGLFERDVTETGTKAIRRPSFERSPKRKRGPAVRKITACGAPRGARRVRQRMRNHRICAFRRATPFGGNLLGAHFVGSVGQVSKPRMLKRIAAMKEHALMVERTQQTPYLPLVGRSDDAFWRVGVGKIA